jgi:hypothetical protein
VWHLFCGNETGFFKTMASAAATSDAATLA